MEILDSPESTLAVKQAQTLLRAWVLGEAPRLEAELDRTVFIALPRAIDCQDERMALLKSIALEMKSCRNLFAERTSDPQVGLCVDLLAHLADSAAMPVGSVAARMIPPGNQSVARADPLE